MAIAGVLMIHDEAKTDRPPYVPEWLREEVLALCRVVGAYMHAVELRDGPDVSIEAGDVRHNITRILRWARVS